MWVHTVYESVHDRKTEEEKVRGTLGKSDNYTYKSLSPLVAGLAAVNSSNLWCSLYTDTNTNNLSTLCL